MYENMSFVYINQIVKPRSTSQAILGRQYGPNPSIQPWKLCFSACIDRRGPASDSPFCASYFIMTYLCTEHSITVFLQTFSKASGLGINTQALEKLITLGRAVTPDLVYFDVFRFMSISHHINLLLINLGKNPFPRSTTLEIDFFDTHLVLTMFRSILHSCAI